MMTDLHKAFSQIKLNKGNNGKKFHIFVYDSNEKLIAYRCRAIIFMKPFYFTPDYQGGSSWKFIFLLNKSKNM